MFVVTLLIQMITSVFFFEKIFFMWCGWDLCISLHELFPSYICLIIYFYSKKFFFEDIKNKLCCFHLDDFLFKKFSYKKIHILFIFSHFVCVFMFFRGQRKKILHSWLKLRKRVDIPQRVSFTFFSSSSFAFLLRHFSRRCLRAAREVWSRDFLAKSRCQYTQTTSECLCPRTFDSFYWSSSYFLSHLALASSNPPFCRSSRLPSTSPLTKFKRLRCVHW